MAMTGHKTLDAARHYEKRTDTQRLIGARKRRAFLSAEQDVDGSRKTAPAAESKKSS